MAASSKLRVMISSRCLDPFPAGQKKIKLSEIRKELKKDIEAIELLGKKPFEVWINEETPRRAVPGISGMFACRRRRTVTC